MNTATWPSAADAEANDWCGPTRAAALAGITVRTLSNLKAKGEGPPEYRLGDRICRYRESEVLAWVQSRRR